MIEARIHRKKYSFWAFDIESHNDVESIAKRETSMWLGSLINDESKMEDESSYLYSMREFLMRCQELVNPSRKGKTKNAKKPIKNVCIYIYNLSFEWSFILPELLNEGFEFKENISDEDEFVFNSISTRSVSSVWCVNIKFNKGSGNLMLRDLSKIYGGGLAKVAKSFNLPTQKGEIDYRLNRLHGHIVTKEEKEYCFKDTRIIIDILLKMVEKADKDFFNANSASSYAMLKMIRTGWCKAYRPYQEFRKKYPVLNPDETAFLRNSVAGGITYAPSNWQFKDIKQKILHIDAHNMHPTSAYFNIFPYGEGRYFKGKPTKYFSRINCCHIKVSYTGVKLHSVIQLIGIEFIEDYELTVWDFEIPTMKKCYIDLEIKYIDGYEYRTSPLKWRDFYADNYNKRLVAKKNKDEFNIMFYKLLNNSSYGKLLEKPHNLIFANCLDEDDIITSEVIEKEAIEYNAKYTYLPVGSCIPAYSRVNLIETALLFGWENIVYFDTDSIFAIYTPEVEKVWKSNQINKRDFLGGWALEEMIDRAQFVAPKRYKTVSDNITTIKAGGFNFDDKYNFDEISLTSSSWEVKRSFRVKGGTIIDVQRKDMTVPDKYKDIYNNNIK